MKKVVKKFLGISGISCLSVLLYSSLAHGSWLKGYQDSDSNVGQTNIAAIQLKVSTTPTTDSGSSPAILIYKRIPNPIKTDRDDSTCEYANASPSQLKNASCYIWKQIDYLAASPKAFSFIDPPQTIDQWKRASVYKLVQVGVDNNTGDIKNWLGLCTFSVNYLDAYGKSGLTCSGQQSTSENTKMIDYTPQQANQNFATANIYFPDAQSSIGIDSKLSLPSFYNTPKLQKNILATYQVTSSNTPTTKCINQIGPGITPIKLNCDVSYNLNYQNKGTCQNLSPGDALSTPYRYTVPQSLDSDAELLLAFSWSASTDAPTQSKKVQVQPPSSENCTSFSRHGLLKLQSISSINQLTTSGNNFTIDIYDSTNMIPGPTFVGYKSVKPLNLRSYSYPMQKIYCVNTDNNSVKQYGYDQSTLSTFPNSATLQCPLLSNYVTKLVPSSTTTDTTLLANPTFVRSKGYNYLAWDGGASIYLNGDSNSKVNSPTKIATIDTLKKGQFIQIDPTTVPSKNNAHMINTYVKATPTYSLNNPTSFITHNIKDKTLTVNIKNFMAAPGVAVVKAILKQPTDNTPQPNTNYCINTPFYCAKGTMNSTTGDYTFTFPNTLPLDQSYQVALELTFPDEGITKTIYTDFWTAYAAPTPFSQTNPPTVSDITKTSATFNWQPGKQTDPGVKVSYMLNVCSEKPTGMPLSYNCNGTLNKSISAGAATTASISDLSANTAYYATVTTTGNNQSLTSNDTKFSTSSASGQTTPPSNIKFTLGNIGWSGTLSWTAASSAQDGVTVDKYNITITPQPSGLSDSTTKTSVPMTVSRDTKYIVTISARFSNGQTVANQRCQIQIPEFGTGADSIDCKP